MLAFLNCSQLLYLSINIWNFICYHFLINLNFYFLPLQKQVLITYLCDDLQFADPWWFPVSRVDFFVGLPVDWTMHWQVLPLVSIKPLLIINGIQVKMLLKNLLSFSTAFITFNTLQSVHISILINSIFFNQY